MKNERAITPVDNQRLASTPGPDAGNVEGTIATSDEMAKIKDKMTKMNDKIKDDFTRMND